MMLQFWRVISPPVCLQFYILYPGNMQFIERAVGFTGVYAANACRIQVPTRSIIRAR